MLVVAAAILIAGALFFVFFVREKDLPAPAPQSPFQHLDDRKAAIYENLRDLQFEYRLGKLSEEDYQKTKAELQRELARILAEIDALKQKLGVLPRGRSAAVAPSPAPTPARGFTCPHCGATFDRELKYCGECGKPMTPGAST
ncbi:MAG: hypothetical protein NZV14_16260 [Bryobacteraceae bacterium]|nr:hypothetical protein [Bryobacteraceae bacterium]MDW8379716.1 hypothetical protein [Bryobacterales bacterium]